MKNVLRCALSVLALSLGTASCRAQWFGGGCGDGGCGMGGCGTGGCGMGGHGCKSIAAADQCDDGCGKKHFFARWKERRHREDCGCATTCEMKCQKPCWRDRIRDWCKKRSDCCEQPCQTCAKPAPPPPPAPACTSCDSCEKPKRKWFSCFKKKNDCECDSCAAAPAPPPGGGPKVMPGPGPEPIPAPMPNKEEKKE
jgi:hypothetical protein